MNTLLFDFFFSLSSISVIAWLSLFLSYMLIYILIILAIIIPILTRRDLFYGLLTFMTGVGTWVFVYIIKNIFIIPRPFVALEITPLYLETGFSFPSSHVAVIAALSILVWKINHKWGIVFFASTILIGISRMVIGVHYPLDVIGGLCLGIIIGFVSLFFYKITNKFAFLRKYI